MTTEKRISIRYGILKEHANFAAKAVLWTAADGNAFCFWRIEFVFDLSSCHLAAPSSGAPSCWSVQRSPAARPSTSPPVRLPRKLCGQSGWCKTWATRAMYCMPASTPERYLLSATAAVTTPRRTSWTSRRRKGRSPSCSTATAPRPSVTPSTPNWWESQAKQFWRKDLSNLVSVW